MTMFSNGTESTHYLDSIRIQALSTAIEALKDIPTNDAKEVLTLAIKKLSRELTLAKS